MREKEYATGQAHMEEYPLSPSMIHCRYLCIIDLSGRSFYHSREQTISGWSFFWLTDRYSVIV